MDNEVGYVTDIRDFLIYLDGLPTIKVNDIIEADQGVRAVVSAVYPEKVEALLLDESTIYPGQIFKRLNKRLAVDIGDFLLGRIINPLGVPLDEHGIVESKVKNLVELDRQATGIYSRQFINDQFITGITVIDTVIPIGKGQRELVLGDAHSGKTSFLINLLINQKNTGVICIYTLIGKPLAQVKSLIDVLRTNDALKHTIVIAAPSSEPAPLIFYTPQTAFTIAEYFQKKGKDVLVILDDMGAHAKIYREIALLSNKFPGRDSYPGDIFYQHSHLMERAGKFNAQYGGGSITAVPVVETGFSDFATFIPTNLMAMTDGHLLFRSSLHNRGQRPAIDIALSVSRVGRQTQPPVQNNLSLRVRQVIAQATELETVSQFGSELPPETRQLLHRSQLIMEILKQDSLTLIPPQIQVILLSLIFTTYFDNKNLSFLHKYKKILTDSFMADPTLAPITKSILNLPNDTELIKLLETTIPRLNQICR